MTARVLFYVQHLLGIGHIARASRVAQALARAGFEVTVVTGGLPVPGFPGEGLRTVALPPVVASNMGFSGLADENGQPVGHDFLNVRRDRLLEIVAETKPAVVIIEAFPFGRRQMRFELLPLLESIKASRPRPKLVVSVRDILQENRKAGRDEETVDLVRDHFDAVLVHGDPNFVRLEDTFPLADRIADLVRYTGLVASPHPPPPAEQFDIVVSAGGGAVGHDLIAAARQASGLTDNLLRWLLVAGPNLPEADFAALSADLPANATLQRFRRDFPSLLLASKVSVSQAGYNTVCDLLRANCRSILIPFVAGGETEQTVRANRLAELGRASVITESGLSGSRLAQAVEQALGAPHPQPAELDLEGAARSAEILHGLLQH